MRLRPFDAAPAALVTAVLGSVLTPLGAANASETAMTEPTYTQVVDDLLKAAVPVKQLGGEGRVAVTLAAGRVIAMAFSTDGPNLLWSNPQLGDPEILRRTPEKLVGGLGGDRLWFSPELAYYWNGEPDWTTFSNYKAPPAADPGAYQFVKQDERSITLRAEGELLVQGTDRRVGFEVERSIHIADPPLPRGDPLMKSIEYVGIEYSHVLKISDRTQEGQIDLWHLLQVPAGTILIVPTKKTGTMSQSKPLSYGLPGAWVEKSDHVMWRYGGEAHAKFGLSASALTGRSALFRKLDSTRWYMIVREFPIDPHAKYGDHPRDVPRVDQAFQAWDGFGFGEMEFHSPIADAEDGPRELRESDRLWAFGGPPHAIAALAERLLGVNVGYVLR